MQEILKEHWLGHFKKPQQDLTKLGSCQPISNLPFVGAGRAAVVEGSRGYS